MVDNFLFCFSLESGGIFIGMMELFVSLFLCCVSTLGLASTTYKFESLSRAAYYLPSDYTKQIEQDYISKQSFFTVIFFVNLAFAVMGYKLVKGIESRRHFKVQPMMIGKAFSAIFQAMLGVFFHLCFLDSHQKLNIPKNLFLSGFITMVICTAYSFLILESLHDKLKREGCEGSFIRIRPADTQQYPIKINSNENE